MRKWINLVEAASPAAQLREQLIELGKSMGLRVDIALHHDSLIELSLLITPDESRRKGLATRFMTEMCRLSDAVGVDIELYAEPIMNALPWSSLIEFYKRFGFVETEIDGKGYMERPARHA